jgi:hypothetical protein
MLPAREIEARTVLAGAQGTVEAPVEAVLALREGARESPKEERETTQDTTLLVPAAGGTTIFSLKRKIGWRRS